MTVPYWNRRVEPYRWVEQVGGYTGQARLGDTGLYYFKARIYAPALGRFLQTDPVGYDGGLNLYAYASADPINRSDPTGQADIYVTAPHWEWSFSWSWTWNTSFDFGFLPQIPNFSINGAAIAAAQTQLVNLKQGADATNEVPESGDAAPTPSQIDDIVVTAARARQIGDVRINFNLRYPQEQLWVLYGLDDFVYLEINGIAKGNTGENRGTPPRPGYVAIIHTHPSWAEYDPGPKDFGHRVPLYGITPSGVWVIRPGAISPTRLYGLRP